MPVVINGTTGITNPDGTAAAPALTGTDTNTGIFFPAADTIAFSEGGAEAMRIDSSGNVGIGTSSPVSKLHVVAQQTAFANDLAQLIISGTNTNQRLLIGYNTTDDKGFIQATKVGTAYQDLLVQPNGGNVGIGTSSPSFKLDVSGTGRFTSSLSVLTGATTTAGLIVGADATVANTWTIARDNVTTGDLKIIGNTTERLRIEAAGALILAGSTAQKATGTTWSNPSDQRLKDNIRDYDKGIDELMQVRVREWKYNGKGGTVEGTKGMGVVADEVMVVLPDTVENYEAKLNADDEEVTAIKKFDATEITWLLVKTVQEQQAIITALTARITALEGTP